MDGWTEIVLAHPVAVVGKAALIALGARLSVWIMDRVIGMAVAARSRGRFRLDTRRSRTLTKLLHNAVAYLIYLAAIVWILRVFGVDPGPVLAGAGIIGLAIGFGAQNLIRDVITGFFILLEDQFAVGDVVQIGSFKGTVEEIGLRVTKLRSWTGELHIIPNGSIAQVTNFSVYPSLAVVDVPVAGDVDPDEAIRVINEAVGRLHEEHESVLKPPEVLGIQTIGLSETVLRVVAECSPNRQTEVSRLLNREIKKALDRAGLRMRSG